LTATGEVKRFATKDIDPTPPPMSPLYRPPPSTPPIYDVVRTKNGSLYYGEIIERVAGDHVTLKLETGETKVIAWEDVDPTPLPQRAPPPRASAPVETVHAVDGSIYHGGIVELVAHDHVTLELANGQFRTIPWDDVDLSHPPQRTHPPRAVPMGWVEFSTVGRRASLQRLVDGEWTDVCDDSCFDQLNAHGAYRVGGPGLAPSQIFRLSAGSNKIVARLGSRWQNDLGRAFIGISVPALIASTILLGVTLNMDTELYYENHAPLDAGTALACFVSTGLLAAGIALAVVSADHVTLNGRRLAQLATEGIRF